MPPFSHHHVSHETDTPDGQSPHAPVLTSVVDEDASHADNSATTSPVASSATEESVQREKQQKRACPVQERDRCIVHVDLKDSESIDRSCHHSNNVVPLCGYYL